MSETEKQNPTQDRFRETVEISVGPNVDGEADQAKAAHAIEEASSPAPDTPPAPES